METIRILSNHRKVRSARNTEPTRKSPLKRVPYQVRRAPDAVTCCSWSRWIYVIFDVARSSAPIELTVKMSCRWPAEWQVAYVRMPWVVLPVNSTP